MEETVIQQKIGDILVKKGFITEEQKEEVLLAQKNGSKKMFGEIAMNLGFIEFEDIIRALKEKW